MPPSSPKTLVTHFSFLRTVPYASTALLHPDERDCPVCLAPYTATAWQPDSEETFNRPVLLHCKHTICISCLARWMFTSAPFPNHCPHCWVPIVSATPADKNWGAWDSSGRLAWMTFVQIEFAVVRSTRGRWGDLAERLYKELESFEYGKRGSYEAKEMRERMLMLFEIYFEPLRRPRVSMGGWMDETAVEEDVVRHLQVEIQHMENPHLRLRQTERITWSQTWTQLKGEIGVLAVMLLISNLFLLNPAFISNTRPVEPGLILRLDLAVAGLIAAVVVAGTQHWRCAAILAVGAIWMGWVGLCASLLVDCFDFRGF